MRYLKSAAFLLLTASSSVSLLSQVAKAAVGTTQNLDESSRVDSVNPLDESPSSAQRVKKQPATKLEQAIWPTHLAERYALSQSPEVAEPESTLGAIAQNTTTALSPAISTDALPKFDRLRSRLLSDAAQPLPEEVLNSRRDRALIQPTFQTIAVEVVEQTLEDDVDASTNAEASTLPTVEAQPANFIQPPLTLDSFRSLVKTNPLNSSETQSTEVVNGEADEATLTAQTSDQDTLPTLEDEPSEDAPSEVTPEPTPRTPPDISPATPPTQPEASDSEPASAGPDESIPAPTAIDETEIGELPAILFADPDPLSFPTSTEEVDIEQNPV
ncbi:MAG: hypothetical protein AAFN12_01515, partial [Cyanobacteria bacterium J06560_2]